MTARLARIVPTHRGHASILVLALLALAIAGGWILWTWDSVEAPAPPAGSAEPAANPRPRVDPPGGARTGAAPPATRPEGPSRPVGPAHPTATRPDDPPRWDERGDRIVIGLDGLELRQPREASVPFAIFREGERNELGLPTGVLPDGSWVYYNIPTRVTRDGETIETLNRYVATPAAGEIVDPDTGRGSGSTKRD